MKTAEETEQKRKEYFAASERAYEAAREQTRAENSYREVLKASQKAYIAVDMLKHKDGEIWTLNVSESGGRVNVWYALEDAMRDVGNVSTIVIVELKDARANKGGKMTANNPSWPVSPERMARGLYWQEAWKLVEGCTHISAGCDNCWSATETRIRSRAQGGVEVKGGEMKTQTAEAAEKEAAERTKKAWAEVSIK